MRKRLIIALLALLSSLCLMACGSTGSAQFHELSFEVPGNWIEDETSATDSVDEGRMWRKSNGGADWEIRDGGMYVFMMNYDFLGNLDVGLSDYEGANQPTTGMRNAYQSANDYLKLKAFSRSGLDKQLKFEGYTDDEAEYAMSELERTGVDWNVQATRAAEEYLQLRAMSKSRLIEQLEYEGFTSSQANHAADMVY